MSATRYLGRTTAAHLLLLDMSNAIRNFMCIP